MNLSVIVTLMGGLGLFLLGMHQMGFGVLFMGLDMMSGSMSNMKDSPLAAEFLGSLANPFLGVLLGTVITAIIQSSSVTVSILLLMAQQGLMGLPICFYIILGCNIGALFHVVNDIERIGDHAENLADSARTRIKEQIAFSDMAVKELKEMGSRVNRILEYAMDMFANNTREHLHDIMTLEDSIDEMERGLQKHHIGCLTMQLILHTPYWKPRRRMRKNLTGVLGIFPIKAKPG